MDYTICKIIIKYNLFNYKFINFFLLPVFFEQLLKTIYYQYRLLDYN